MPLGSMTRWRPGDSSSWRSRHEVLREQLIAGDRDLTLTAADRAEQARRFAAARSL